MVYKIFYCFNRYKGRQVERWIERQTKSQRERARERERERGPMNMSWPLCVQYVILFSSGLEDGGDDG